MTTTDLPPLDLSVLGRVTPAPEEDSRPAYQPPEPDLLPPLTEEKTPPPRRNARARTTPTSTRKTEPKTDSTDDELPQQYRPGILVKPLTELYILAGTVVAPFNQPVATALVQNAEACAIAWDNAAKTDKQIRRYMMMLIHGSTWGQLAAVHAPIGIALVASVGSVNRRLKVVPSTPGDDVINPVSNG